VWVYIEYQESMKSYLIPNEPQLTVWFDEDDKVYFQSDLANPNHIWDVDVCIQNSGRMSTGPINMWWVRDLVHPSHAFFENLGGGTTRCTEINVRHKDCFVGDPDDICDETKVPIGENTLTLTIDCIFCNEKQKKFNQTFDICVMSKLGTECEEFK